MATVTALQSFVGRLSKDVLGPDRIEKHSQFTEPSVFPGGKKFGAGSLEREIVKEGSSIQVQRGQMFDSNHPAVKAFPAMFGEVETIHPPEKATREAGKS